MTISPRIQELLDEEIADLDPELAAYMEACGPLGVPSIRHPLVYSVIHHERFNGLVNDSLRYKKEALRAARKQRQWHSYVYIHERPWRLDAFVNICYLMGDHAYWELLGDIYTDSENLWQNADLWRDCLTAQRRYRSHLMDAGERETLKNLDLHDTTIYRGFARDGREQGFSWTTDRSRALFFAQRLAMSGDTPRVATGKVNRRDVIACFNGRNEHEVVVLPENVWSIEIVEVGGRTA